MQASKKNLTQTEDISHTLGIVSSLFSNLPSESVARIRLLAKFVENTYEKADKLLEIRDAAHSRLQEVEKEIAAEKRVSLKLLQTMETTQTVLQELESEGEKVDEDTEDLFYLRRLDGGLFTLQTVDYILAWIAMEDDGVGLSLALCNFELLMPLHRFAHTYNKCSVARANLSATSSAHSKHTVITSTKMFPL